MNCASKKPLHEVVSNRLTRVLAGIAGNSRDVCEAEAIMLLEMLQESGMSPAEARNVAEKHRYTPDTLRKAGMEHLAGWAEKVIAGLGSRQDELELAA